MNPRLVVLALVLVVLWMVAQATGLRDAITQQALRQMVDGAGALGILAFVAAFSVGQLVQLPGMVFVLAARAAWGPVTGFVVAYVGALCSVMLSFAVVRAVGGSPKRSPRPDEPKSRWRRALGRLEARPLTTVISLRTVFALSPPLNYALAMSPLRARDYFVGSAAGLLLPIGVWILLSDALIETLSKVL